MLVLTSARRTEIERIIPGPQISEQQTENLYTMESNHNYERYMNEARINRESEQENQNLLRQERASTANKSISKILCDTVDNLENIDPEKIKKWLSRITDIFEFKNNKELFQTICLQIVDYLKVADIFENVDLRESLYIIIEDATKSCGDRMALSIIYLDIQHSFIGCENNLENLFKILINGSWTFHTLENFARYKVLTLKSVDEIEVYIGYIIKLKNDLSIPINIESMLYYSCSCLTPEDLNDAKKFILKNRYTSKTCDFLIEQEVWMNGLKHHFPQKIKNIVNKRDTNENYEKAFEVYKQELRELTLEVCKNFYN
jgi:hypothetical protein